MIKKLLVISFLLFCSRVCAESPIPVPDLCGYLVDKDGVIREKQVAYSNKNQSVSTEFTFVSIPCPELDSIEQVPYPPTKEQQQRAMEKQVVETQEAMQEARLDGNEAKVVELMAKRNNLKQQLKDLNAEIERDADEAASAVRDAISDGDDAKVAELRTQRAILKEQLNAFQ